MRSIYIYQIGGYGLHDGVVVRLNTETASYEDLPSLPSGTRSFHKCLLTTIKGEYGILVTGGYLSSSRNVEFLNLVSHQWTQLASLGQGRYTDGLEMINGKPTVFGGYYGGFLDDFEYYDEDKDSWHTIPNMKLTKHRFRFASVSVNVDINKF